MRKSALIVIGLVGLTGLVSLFLLNRYKTDMIHAAILNAVIQKAPPDYPTEPIERRFETVFREATQRNELDAYLRRLLALAQRLEKIQSLESSEVDEILRNLDKDPAEEEEASKPD